ncbi:MAG: hypothetical protein IJT41_03005 [Clostridia bacterium]|nr:hypothetical protein [Clostridia bacterium]
MLHLRALGLFVISLFSLLFCGTSHVVFTADSTAPADVISNKVSNVNVWGLNNNLINAQKDPENDVFEFVEYVQLMQCSGGSAERDLFRDPLDRSVTDDYDFAPLIENCRSILQLGAKPMLKLGGVPLKLSAEPVLGDYGMNVRPPADYTAYYNYIYALADTLVQTFGRDEVAAWRFGVMTEFENEQWFYAGDRDPQASCEAYCKLYDYTVQALIDAVGEDVFVGAHGMVVTEGLWDETQFIRHVAVGRNYATGETGTRICSLSASFYDYDPGHFTSGKTLPQAIDSLRDTAEKYGLHDLVYGVDEGRILYASPGADSSDLFSRTVGQTWQAAYDARLWTQTIRHNIDYFSSWGYLSDGLRGYPTVSYHVARAVHRMAGSQIIATSSTARPLRWLFGIEVDGAASFDPRTNTARVLVYNFRNKLTYSKNADVQLRLHLPQLAGKRVTLQEWKIDDTCNFFDEWQQDRKTYGITDDCFAWSPDDPCLDNPTTLSDPQARAFYFENLREKYTECAKLTPTESDAQIGEDGMLTLRRTLDPSAVVFLEIG